MTRITPSVERELRTLDLGDERREHRTRVLTSALLLAPEASVPQACGSRSETKAAYRLLSNLNVSAEAIRSAHADATLERARGKKLLLAVQDKSNLDFTCCPGTLGLGPLDSPLCRGLKLQSTLLLDEHGEPLGMLSQEVWARDREELGKKSTRRQRSPQEKESWRWRTGFEEVERRVPPDQEVIGIADRESDIYFVLAMPRREKLQLLIRSAHNRSVESEHAYLRQAVEAAPVLGTCEMDLPRTRKRKPRRVTLEFRAARVTLKPPRQGKNGIGLGPVEVSAVWVRELGEVPKGEKRVEWLLLATWPVETLEQALECARLYSHRWKVERYHYVLKSGCGIEKLQMETADRLERALALYSIIAWRLLWLTYRARLAGNSPCGEALEEREWRVLLAMSHIQQAGEPTLGEAVRLIAMLGGFQGRKGDGDPGVKTVWRGWRRLMDFVLAYQTLASA
ncbi:MAG TPA: IS4 family transposase [Longimicrobium sp.]|nr:IS4 family transposase [Longimicrobium sp.]